MGLGRVERLGLACGLGLVCLGWLGLGRVGWVANGAADWGGVRMGSRVGAGRMKKRRRHW